MNKRKRVGPRIKPCGTPALIGTLGNNLPSKTTLNLQLLRKEDII